MDEKALAKAAAQVRTPQVFVYGHSTLFYVFMCIRRPVLVDKGGSFSRQPKVLALYLAPHSRPDVDKTVWARLGAVGCGVAVSDARCDPSSICCSSTCRHS